MHSFLEIEISMTEVKSHTIHHNILYKEINGIIEKQEVIGVRQDECT
jgi:hypothetical protein